MLPINLDGTGVSEYKDFSAFLMKINERMRKLSGAGLSAIIVANSYEAKDIKNKFDLFGSAINDLTGDKSEIYENKWNLMTVEQAKGLEFNCAVVIISNMTENEKYIACTRALDEMIVYSGEYSVNIAQNNDDKETDAKPKSELKNDCANLKPSKKAIGITISPENKKFFEDRGLEVIDERSLGGDLWLIGKKEETRDIIMQARSKFRISSIQYGEKSPGVSGWHTKSKNI